MHPLHDFLLYLRFTNGLSPSDVIGWILAGLAGIIAYKLIDHMQTAIERHGMLSSVEDGVSALFDSFIAFSLPPGEDLTEDNADNHQVMVRSVLHDFTGWEHLKSPDGKGGFDVKIIKRQRYIHIRDDAVYNEWISTQALHELCLKMRRIEKMFKGGIIKRIDLSDMFREIVPLGMSGRLEFLRDYYGDYDAECIAYLVMQTLVSCAKYRNTDIVREFAVYYKDNEPIHSLFLNNRRVRKIRDFQALRHFRKLMD